MELYPTILEHAAALVGRTPWEVSRDAGLLAQAHARAYELYHHDPVVCGVDVYHLEVEAWGVPVERPPGNAVPMLGAPLAEWPDQWPELDPARDGRLAVVLAAARSLPVPAEVRVPVAGPFAVATGLIGFDRLLVEMVEDPARVREQLILIATHQAGLSRRWQAVGLAPVVYESGAAPPLVSPQQFRDLIAPALRIIMAAGPVPCIIGGDTALVAEPLLATGPRAVICPAETNQAAFMRVARDWPDVAVRLNLPAAVVAGGDLAAAEHALGRLAEWAVGHPRAVLGTGVVPYDAAPEFIQALQRIAREKLPGSGRSFA